MADESEVKLPDSQISDTPVVDQEKPEDQKPDDFLSALGEKPDEKEVVEEKKVDEPAKPQPYTDDELISLYESGGVIDRNRLTPAQEVLRRMVQRGITKEKEELQVEREKIESEKKQTDPYGWGDVREKYYQEYTKNPIQIARTISNEISRLRTVGDEESNLKVYQLEAMREEFRERLGVEREQRMLNEGFKEKRDVALAQIANFDEKSIAMDAVLAKVKGGFSQKQLQRILSDPELSIPFINSMMYFHDTYVNAGKSADKKEVKKPPVELARPGGKGSGEPPKKKGAWDLSDPEFEIQIEKAKHGGR